MAAFGLDVRETFALQGAGQLTFFVSKAHLADRRPFLRHLAPVRKKRWVIYAKSPFAGPEAVLVYLARYTHRVAISNRRLIAFDESGVTFRYKDYRRDGTDRQQIMTLASDEFTRRVLLHVLPRGFHSIRHYGLLPGSPATPVSRSPVNSWTLPRRPMTTQQPNQKTPARHAPLRRTHDHHRDVRTLETAARTAARISDEPGNRPMTRHDLSQHHAAGASLPATDPRASMVTVAPPWSRRAGCGVS